MGRYIKNVEIKTGSYSFRLPIGSSTLGPDNPVGGLMRYNETTAKPEIYVDNEWRAFVVSSAGSREVSKDTYYGNGVVREFGPMKYSYNSGDEIMILVFVGNVFQNPGMAYTVDGNNISFTSTPPDGQYIVILHGFAG
jgi:hypothetical protein